MTAQFIQIPAVGSVPAFDLDPDNKAQVLSLIERADAYFAKSKRFWERGNNSGNAAVLAHYSELEQSAAAKGEALLAPLGIKCDWPGLYPSFQVNGYSEHATGAAVLAALGKPRNWLAA